MPKLTKYVELKYNTYARNVLRICAVLSKVVFCITLTFASSEISARLVVKLSSIVPSAPITIGNVRMLVSLQHFFSSIARSLYF